MNSPIPIWRAGQHLLRGISALCVWGILSSFLQLFRLFSDFKGVQYRTGKCNQYIYNFMSFYLHSKDCFSCRKFANIFCNPFFTFCAIQNLGFFYCDINHFNITCSVSAENGLYSRDAKIIAREKKKVHKMSS